MAKVEICYVKLSEETLKQYKKMILKAKEILPLKRYLAYIKLEDDMMKIQNIIGYLLLKKMLENSGINTTNLGYSYHKNGKPYFNNSYIKFNISHSDNIIAVAIDEEEIGLDVEKIDEVNSCLTKRVYSNEEQILYQKNLLNNDFFYKTWTIKESYLKYIGTGLNLDVTSLTFNLEEDLNKLNEIFIVSMKIDDFYLSFSSKKKEYQINEITIEQLFNES